MCEAALKGKGLRPVPQSAGKAAELARARGTPAVAYIAFCLEAKRGHCHGVGTQGAA